MEALLLVALSCLAVGDDWAMAHSDNFIVNAPSADVADEALRLAEVYRREIAIAWLGEELADGEGPAIINITLSDDRDSAATLPINSANRKRHMVIINSSERLALGSNLAHEVTHVVMATRFGAKFPAWADEGIAGICDDDKTKGIRAQLIKEFAASGRWPSVVEILSADRISPSDQQTYTVSVSLTRFLLDRGSREEFMRFVDHGMHDGWDASARASYGFANTRDLDLAWRRWAADNPEAEFEPVVLESN